MRKLHVATLRSIRTYLTGASVVALLAGASAAWAGCTTGDPIICTGATVGKVTLTSTGTVDVTNGATLAAGATDDAALGVTSDGSPSGYAYLATYANINIDGTISGNQYGVVGSASGFNYAYPSTSLNMLIGATGQVLGQTAIYLDAGAAGYHTVTASLGNNGLVQGSNVALDYNGSAGFSFINNEATGVIRGVNGAILAPVGTLTNAGLIDGGSGSAYAIASPAWWPIYPSGITNSGTMTSSSALGTIYLAAASPPLTNSGTIRNTVGSAIYAGNYLALTNTAGGTIVSPSTVNAIYATNGANIVNQGTITGSVFVDSTYSYSILDNTKGTIDGDVVFGSGNNALRASWDASANRIAGISGTVSGTAGTGTNTLQLAISQDLTLDNMFAHLTMPANFQNLGISLEGGVTGTVNGDAPDGLQLGGSGNFVTTGQITSAGTSFAEAGGLLYNYSAQLGFTNTGSIHSVFSPPGGAVQYGDYAVSLNSVGSFSNSGTITAVTGNGVSIGLSTINWQTPATFSNTGSIVADGTALNLMMNAGAGGNDGIIRSTGGIGLSLSGYSNIFSNTGSITGATTGASIFSGALSNSGTITGTTVGVQATGTNLWNSGTISATNGTGVNLGYGNIYNLADGVITGSGDAIADTYGGATVTNAGTINGNVVLGPSYYYSYGDTFIDNGGTVNGSVRFGMGTNTYVTDFSKFANGTFSNVTGVVDGGNGFSTLVLRTGSDTTAKIAFATNFQRTEYDLSNNAKLSLSSDSAISDKTVILAGTGSVDLTADFSVTNMPGLIVTTLYGLSGTPATLSVVSHGNMSFSDTSYYAGAGVQLLNTASFENAGKITAVSQNNYAPSTTAITGGAVVTNSGTITVDAAAAITGAIQVNNTGSIAQAANGQSSYGLYGVNNVVNSGSIITSNAAVTVNYYNNYYYYYGGAQPLPTPSVTNSGVIQSTGADAVDLSYFYNPVTITNAAGGQILSDTAYAINSNAFTTNIHNDGVIKGNINLNYFGNDLVENHGTITGNITFNYGSGTFLLTGGTFTGTADATSSWGYNRLVLDVTDANAPPLALGTSAFNGFQELDMQGGTATMGGTYTFNTVDVSGGRLIGLAGSQLSASNISVAQGATFGSAGKVSGNIVVNGTLSPGASPGTMTVAGDVTLAKGSTALFELTPTVDDKLLVSGKLTIADGATLQFAAGSIVMPGQKFDLIDATGGISGKFATLSGAPANLHLIQSADTLQGLGLFTASQAFSTQVTGTIATFNTALINGTLDPSLAAALPALADSETGNSNPNALLRVTPQAYASASRLATEDALAVVDALRDESHFAQGASGGFAYVRAVSTPRKMAGDDAAGIAGGRLTGSGGLSGLGYATKSAWISAFGGYLDGQERLPELEARTTTHGLVLGVQGQVRAGAFRLGALAAYDRDATNTWRTAPADIGASSRYALKSRLVNIDLAYRVPLGADWSVEPRLAASYVRTIRDAATEQGGGVFALAVDAGHSTNSFVDGQVELDGGQSAGRTMHPYVSVGFVTRTGGQADMATASLNGLPVPLSAYGLDLAGTRATVGAGVRYSLSGRLGASVGYTGEFGKNGRQSLDVGLHWAF